jgi:hypothetical protein
MSCSCPKIEVTTSGIPPTTSICGKQANVLFKCTTCAFTYQPDIKSSDENEDNMCLHCYYWIYYVTRLEDSKIPIVDYILKCSDEHEPDKCTKMTDAGGCYLCEYKLGMLLDDIPNYSKLLNKDSTVPDNVTVIMDKFTNKIVEMDI